MAAPFVLVAIGAIHVQYLRWKSRRLGKKQAVSPVAKDSFKVAVGATAVLNPVTGAGLLSLILRPAWLEKPVRGTKVTWSEVGNKAIFFFIFFLLGMLIPGTAMAWKIGILAGAVAYFA
jgi:hypothetical protein